MKKYLTVFLLLIVGVSNAQEFNYGIKVSAGSSFYSFEELSYVNTETQTVLLISPYQQNFAYNLGGMALYEFENTRLSLRGALQYTNYSAEVNILDGFDNSSKTILETSHRIDIPISVVLRLKTFRLFAGFGYVFDVARSDRVADYINDQYADESQVPFTVTSNQQNYFTYHAGLGFRWNKTTLDVVWESAFTEDLSGEAGDSYNFAPNPSTVMLSLGFLFK